MREGRGGIPKQIQDNLFEKNCTWKVEKTIKVEVVFITVFEISACMFYENHVILLVRIILHKCCHLIGFSTRYLYGLDIDNE
jgi:hypothetical protein